MKWYFKILAFSLALTVVGISVAQARGFKQIVVFGESSSDTGNVDILQCPSPPEWGPWAPCTSAYFDGNPTNGRIWVEFLAKKLRVPAPEPSLLGGTNYAHAGAKTQFGDNLRISLVTGQPVPGSEVPGVLSQVNSYLSAEYSFNKKDLVVIWAGANDLRDIQGPEDLQQVLYNLGEAIGLVACNGAKHIVVPNQLNASVSPAVRYSGVDPVQVEEAVRGFNLALRAMVDNLQDTLPSECETEAVLHYVDVFTTGEAIIAFSELFGKPYSNLEDPAVNLATFEVPEGVKPNDHLFLDTIHVTTPAQRAIARKVYTLLKYRIPR